MCGIAGCLQRGISPDQLAAGLRRMLAALNHRGPDDEGIWLDASRGLGLGHRRLAIRDLSPAGHQPMFTDDGNWGLTYNGEIYNADDLRQRLDGATPWRGHSDTEVLLRAIQTWGLPKTLSQLAGMFAFAVWNRDRQTVTLVRDRLGIKPLYYSLQQGRVFWASELKGLLAHPDFHAEIDPAALQRFLQFGYVPAPHCILRRTWKLQPGCYLELDVRSPTSAREHVFWDAAQVAQAARAERILQDGQTDRRGGDDVDRQIVQQTHTALAEIIQQHLTADVPVGAFLSGGIDSSLVVALMQAQSTRPIQTFSIGFHEPDFDEAPYARRIAAMLGTEHHEWYLSSDQLADLIPAWAEHYCEPFSDTSGLPSLMVCRHAQPHVRVALTGDGGDELFAGYRRYPETLAIQGRLRRVPHRIRNLLAHLLAIPADTSYHRLQTLQRWLAPHLREGLAESVRKTRSLLAAGSEQELYECLASISFNANAHGLLTADAQRAAHGDSRADASTGWQSNWELLGNMQLWDSQRYLPNDILHKMDIASMSVGLEVRVPLLDHRLYERAWQLPDRLKLSGHRGKLLLRRVLAEYLPESEFDRPKRGFSAPLDAWLRGPLRDWAESLLLPCRWETQGLIEPTKVKSYWDDLIAGRAGHARIWPVLVFLAWQRHHLNSTTSNDEHCVRNTGDDTVCLGR